MSEHAVRIAISRISERTLVPIVSFIGVYLTLMYAGNQLLNDADSWWQVVLGQQMLEQRSVPFEDIYSFTTQGVPWHSTQWLSQVLFAAAMQIAGWAGVVSLTSAAIALTFAVLTYELLQKLSLRFVACFAGAAFLLSAAHMLARPHVLAWPLMVIWVAGLMRAADARQSPSPWLLIAMVLWANLHGGFIFGIALVAPIALDAVIASTKPERPALFLKWFVFGCAAVLASCINPYGWQAIASSFRILEVGGALTLIGEWRPADFSKFGELQFVLLAGIALALWRGVQLPVMRAVIVVGLIYMALNASRNQELLAFLAPLVMAAPLSRQFESVEREGASLPGASFRMFVMFALAAIIVCATSLAVVHERYAPSAFNAPSGAVDEIKERKLQRVFNDYDFGGYLIARGVPVFIDGRTELYGGEFLQRYSNILDDAGIENIETYLAQHMIDGVLIRANSRLAKLIDRSTNWRRVHHSSVASLYVKASP